MVTHVSLAVLGLRVSQVSCVHVVFEDQGDHANEDGHDEGVGDGDPQVSVDVEKNHANNSSTATEPAIGLIQVLEEEVGEESGSYEEEGVHGVLSLEDGCKYPLYN